MLVKYTIILEIEDFLLMHMHYGVSTSVLIAGCERKKLNSIDYS